MKINETEHNLTECDNFYDPRQFFVDSLNGLIMQNVAKMYSKLFYSNVTLFLTKRSMNFLFNLATYLFQKKKKD